MSIQYTSRTAATILADINNDEELKDKPNWWKQDIKGIGDVISMWNNAAANNSLLRTSFTRKNTQLILELIDYFMSGHETANGSVIFYVKDTAVFPFTVDVSDLVAVTTGNIAVSSKRFEARSGLTVSAISEAVAYIDVDYTTDEFTVTREYTTGERVRLTTSGVLPDPLSVNTNYYVIAIDSTTIKLATSLVNAYNGANIDLVNSGSGSHTVNLYSFQVTMYQQQSKESFIVGTSDGSSNFQEFKLADKNILSDTLSVVVNSQSYSKIDTWVDSAVTDKHYRLFFNTDNTSLIQFGGNDFGEIPPAFDVYVSYSFGGGIDSNVSTVGRLNVYAGSDQNIDGVSNPVALTGGAEPESAELAKILGPLLLKSRARFVTSGDGESQSLNYAGIALSRMINNAYGPLSCKSVNIANGGGQISSSLQAELQSFLIDITVLESVDVRVVDATISAQNTTSAAKLLPGYSWSGGVEDYYRLAWKLFWSEAGYEIKSLYDSDGIETAVTLINVIFTESFGANDYIQIQKLLDRFIPRTFYDEEIQDTDAITFVAGNIDGIDYITISAPTFPVSLAEDEITTYGSLTLTEIT